MQNTIEDIGQILAAHKSNERIDVVCSHCGTKTSKSYRYVRERFKQAIEGIVEIFCCSQCYYDSKSSLFNIEVNCDCCGKTFIKPRSQINKTNSNFCSSSCAAKVNNLNRVRSEESKKKTSESLKKLKRIIRDNSSAFTKTCKFCESLFITSDSRRCYCSEFCKKSSKVESNAAYRKREALAKSLEKEANTNLYCYIKFLSCKECGSVFYVTSSKKSNTKFCSKECRITNQSRFQSEYISKAENRKNLGSHKPSYPETLMLSWLDANQIRYRFEPSFKNHRDGKTYFPDFVFDDIKLIIELDGTQHRKTVEKDKYRDAYIFEEYGYTVKRFWCKDFLKGRCYEEICDILSVKEDKLPPKFKLPVKEMHDQPSYKMA